jgi:hypothetical protein
MMTKKTEILMRFAQVFNDIYGGQTLLMAADLEKDPTLIQRYLAGKVKISTKSLTTLSRVKNISLQWLLNGEGGEKVQFVTPATQSPRPVTAMPCEVVPVSPETGFCGMYRETAPFHNVRDRYWLHTQQPIAKADIKVGDYVLVQVCCERPCAEEDVGMLFVLRRKEKLLLDVVTKDDVASKSDARIFGRAIMLERDLGFAHVYLD